MADDRDRNRDAEDEPGGNSSVSDLVDDDLGGPDTPSESEGQDEGPKVSDEEGLP
jgi:hypothetical protein